MCIRDSLSIMQLLQRPQGQVVEGEIRLNLGNKAYDVTKAPDTVTVSYTHLHRRGGGDPCHRRRTQERRGHLQPPAVKLYDTTQLNLMEAAT